MRTAILVLGICLLMLSVVGFVYHATVWLTAFHLALGLAALGVIYTPDPGDVWIRYTPFGFGAALLAVWIAALALDGEAWLAWWTFVLAVSYLLVGVAYTVAAIPTRHEPQRTRRV